MDALRRRITALCAGWEVAQIRAMYANPERHRIVPYLLLPDQFPPPNWDTGNYHANGFAALETAITRDGQRVFDQLFDQQDPEAAVGQ